MQVNRDVQPFQRIGPEAVKGALLIDIVKIELADLWLTADALYAPDQGI